MRLTALLLAVVLLCSTFTACTAQKKQQSNDKLAVVWTSGDPDVAHKVCFMYTHNAKKREWFSEVLLIVWGPSAKLLSEDESLQQSILKMKADGVILEACKACSDSYGVSDKLTELGVDVKYMGVPLSNMLKGDWKVITF